VIYILVLSLFLGVFANALTLSEALEGLHKNNTQIQLSDLKIKKSQEKLAQKRSQQYGSIDGFSSITKYNERRNLAPLAPPIAPNIPTDDTLFNVGVSYNVTLFSGFKDSSQIELSNLATNIEKTKHTLTLFELELNVQTLFCDILALQKTKQGWEEYQKGLEKVYQFTQKEVVLGKKSQLELLKIEAQIEDAKSILIDTKTKIAILKRGLSLLIFGIAKEFEIEEFSMISDLNSVRLENLPSLKIASLGVQSKEKLYQSVKSAYYPKVSFTTNYSDVYGDGEKETIFTSSINLVWKLYDFGATKKGIQEARIEQLESKLELEKRTQEIERNIFDAEQNIEKYLQLLQSAKVNLILAKKTNEIEEVLYKEGQKDISDYLLSMANLRQSEAKLVIAQYGLEKAKYYFNTLTKE